MQPWFEFAPFPFGLTIAFNNNAVVQSHALHHHGRGEKAARYR